MSAFNKYAAELIATAKALAHPAKGILASDESNGTIGKRFAPIAVENNAENRKRYRKLLYTTKGLGEYISGAIMFEEALLTDGFVDLLKKEGIIPGIKTDKGVQKLPGTDGETTTQGLTNLHERCQKYYTAGARFAKWRCVLHIKDSGAPTELAIQENARVLARYAAISQANGLVPIVEPEVLMDGDHSIARSAMVTEKVLAATFKALSDHHVLLEGALLKPNMVRSGSSSADQAGPADIARATVRVLQHTVPPALPGINFLSGGMSEELATLALNAINQFGDPARKPWTLSFSYGRALQQSVLKAWGGDDNNAPAAQEQLLIRSKANAEAVQGKYGGGGAKSAAAQESLDVKNYVY